MPLVLKTLKTFFLAIDSGLLHGSCPSPQVPIATKVWVESIEKGFLTLQPLLHMKNGKKCKNANIGTYIPKRC